MNERIFMAEDEDNIRETVKAFLESEGYLVTDFNNGDSLFEEFIRTAPDLVILDVLMPGSTGFEITKKIRQISSVPIIILTARDSEIDYATGINLGSDDYFTKPFSAISLVMRVKAMLRRVRLDKETVAAPDKAELAFADILVNLKTMDVRGSNGEIDLTPSEYNLLVYLIENRIGSVTG